MNEIKLLSSQNDLVVSQTEAAFNNIHDMKTENQMKHIQIDVVIFFFWLYMFFYYS